MLAFTPPVDRTGLLDALWHFQNEYGFISDEAVALLAESLQLSHIEVEGVISFYHFFHRQAAGQYTIYLNNSILSEFAGFADVRRAFEQATGTSFGTTDESGQFGLYETACIGLSDQEPAALINLRPFVRLTPGKVQQIVQRLRNGEDLDDICDQPTSTLQYRPDGDRSIFFRSYEAGAALRRGMTMTPDEILSNLQEAGLRGLGGAFFPVHLKWQTCRQQSAAVKYIVCNADEGEPGTFKDRVLLRRLPGLLLEGMTLAAYTTGATEGFIYLRAEYRYLAEHIQHTIDTFEQAGLLGRNILGKTGFHFSVRLQLGAGAYVCGEETALLQSMEGKRGEPTAKVFFPAEKGFRQRPTVVNNVETLMAAARIIELGPKRITANGTPQFPGNKLLSVAGDCTQPGIYEIEWGIPLGELLDRCGAYAPLAVQLSGPSGELVPATHRERRISPDDLACGGSVMIFGQGRDLMQVLLNYNRFFRHESCGICTPCRGGNFILSRQLDRISQGLADRSDLEQLHNWGDMMKYASRCGLGKTAPNSIVQALERFPEYFQQLIRPEEQNLFRHFDLDKATETYDRITQKPRS